MLLRTSLRKISFLLLFLVINLAAIHAQFCSGTTVLNATSGTITDGSGSANYSNNTLCEWLIQPSGNPASITFTLDSMDLASFNDYVLIYDGVNTAGTFLGIFRYTAAGSPVVATSGSMFIRFSTNGVNTAQGWSGHYTSSSTICQPNTILTVDQGAFTDGSNNGANYLNNTNCEWLIQPTTPNISINLDFSRFAVAAGDFLTIYDGSTNTSPVLATYTGNGIPNAVNSSGGSMLLEFSTNASVTDNGWRAVYTTQQLPFCSGLTTLTTPSGAVTDGSAFADDYAPNSNCEWLISPTGAVSANLNFTYFSTQANSDIVRVYDGNSTTGLLLGTYSGTNLPPSLSSASGEFFLTFTTSNQTNSTGWGATYTSSNLAIIDAVPDTLYINAGAGSIGSFQLNSNTTWTISDNQTWLIPSPISGRLNSTINVLATQGNIGPDRSALLIVAANNGNASDTVVVIQQGSGRYLSSSPDTLFFPSVGGQNQTISVNSNVNWTPSSTAGWINFTPSSGANTATISVNVSDNPLNQLRTDMLVIAGNLNAGNDTVVIVQDSLNYAFSVSPKQLTLNSMSGSSDSVSIQANLNWTASASETWLDLSATAGNDSTNVKITANTSNPTINARTAFIYLDAGNGRFMDTILVDQLGSAPTLSANPDTLLLERESGNSDTVNVITMGNWVASVSNSLFTINQTIGAGNTPLVVTTSSTNNNVNYNEAALYLSNPIFGLSDTVILRQKGVSGTISVNPDSILLRSGSGNSASFDITSNVNWSINNLPSWLSLNQTTGFNNATLTASTNSQNQSGSDRMVWLVIEATGAVSDTIVITQLDINTPDLITVEDTVYLSNTLGSSGSFSILSNTNWSLSKSEAWFAMTPSTGTGDATVSVLAGSANLTGAPRYGTIDIDVTGAQNQTVVIAQAGLPSSLQISPDSLIIGADSTSFGIISITSNLPFWSVSENSDWLIVSPNSSSFNDDITATAVKKNLTGLPRETFITLTAPPLVPQSIKVIQDTNKTIGLKETSFERVFTLYPNPTNGVVMLRAKNISWGTEMETSIFDIHGKELTPTVLFSTNQLAKIDLSNLPNGVYFLFIRYKEEIYSTKFSLIR